MEAFKILTDDYFVGNFGSVAATDEMAKLCNEKYEDSRLRDATVGGQEKPDHSVRKCRTTGIVAHELPLIAVGLKKIIENVNDMRWKMDLKHEWQANVQYTRYLGKGHFYNWHRDAYPKEECDVGAGRQLTIVYCLSYEKDYTGGEFELERDDKTIYTRKFDYGDFIVFPACKLHRVIPLKSGTRTTLVGWYM